MVALLAEGVDRNNQPSRRYYDPRRSPSSRRAWIEISRASAAAMVVMVALLAEGVDRNKFTVPFEDSEKLSPSSRRAWIEIAVPASDYKLPYVALLAEGVDRNQSASGLNQNYRVALLAEGVDRNCLRVSLLGRAFSRPPRGGRG